MDVPASVLAALTSESRTKWAAKMAPRGVLTTMSKLMTSPSELPMDIPSAKPLRMVQPLTSILERLNKL
eukprot:scaffold6366_cov23-Cyclotella_meneghiniana.AAC.1